MIKYSAEGKLDNREYEWDPNSSPLPAGYISLL